MIQFIYAGMGLRGNGVTREWGFIPLRGNEPVFLFDDAATASLANHHRRENEFDIPARG